MSQIARLDDGTAAEASRPLSELLRDVVQAGASIGFLPPLGLDSANGYWQSVVAALRTDHRILLIAREGQALAGTVQLDLAERPNASQRAEVCKLMVGTAFRGRGIAQQLMCAIEDEARQAGRTTLILDTRQGDPSESLYLKLGYSRVGVIPEYARSADGSLHSTVFMYKLLK